MHTSSSGHFVITQPDRDNIKYEENGQAIFFGYDRGNIYMTSPLCWVPSGENKTENIITAAQSNEIISNLTNWFKDRNVNIMIKTINI